VLKHWHASTELAAELAAELLAAELTAELVAALVTNVAVSHSKGAVMETALSTAIADCRSSNVRQDVVCGMLSKNSTTASKKVKLSLLLTQPVSSPSTANNLASGHRVRCSSSSTHDPDLYSFLRFYT
jgi:hypothetical protein